MDPVAARVRLVAFIRSQVAAAGRGRVVLLLSGGIESATVALLAGQALGPDRVHCLLMPARESSPELQDAAQGLAAAIGCPTEVVDISPIMDAAVAATAHTDGLRTANLAARIRMALLLDRAVALEALAVGATNKTDLLLGRPTRHGDDVCDFNPIGDLFETQVRQLATHLGAPAAILGGTPEPGRRTGPVQDARQGLAAAVLDRLLQLLVDESRSVDAVVAEGFTREDVVRVAAAVRAAAAERELPPVARIVSRRHAHTDHG